MGNSPIDVSSHGHGAKRPQTIRPIDDSPPVDVSPHERGAKRPQKRCRKRLKHSVFVNLFLIGL